MSEPERDVRSEQEVVSPAGAAPPPAGAESAEHADGRPVAAVADALADAPDAPAGDAPEGDAPAIDEEAIDEEAELRERASKADVYLDLAQRTQADFDNYRKRMTREVRAAEARGIGRLARELLPALDNLERALAAVDASEPGNHLSEGIRLVTAELSAALGRTGIQGYSPKGEVFDPSQHEAVAQHPVDGAESGTVVEVLQSGYRLNEAILRPARVIVAS